MARASSRASLFAGGRASSAGRRGADARAARRAGLAEARERSTRRASTSPRGRRPLRVAPLEKEWTRIGRSLAADIRFDDPTVSRRHALIVRQADGVRVLDDRSLNGVFVNGERVEWRALTDGDEIVVGRYRLQFLDVVAGTEPAGSALESTG